MSAPARTTAAVKIIDAHAAPHVATARELFVEYAQSLGFSLCFQGFDQELATLPGRYAPPRGCLLLALMDEAPAGCVALRPLEEPGVCEMKRLFVRPAFRGAGLGRALAAETLARARLVSYERMVLDTLATMTAAMSLYKSLGFAPTAAYNFNPSAEVRYFELALAGAGPARGAEEVHAEAQRTQSLEDAPTTSHGRDAQAPQPSGCGCRPKRV